MILKRFSCRQLNTETFLGDVSIGCSNPPQGEITENNFIISRQYLLHISNEDETTEEMSAESVDKPSSESPPTTNNRYPHTSRAGVALIACSSHAEGSLKSGHIYT